MSDLVQSVEVFSCLIFIIKKCVVFTYFCTLKYGCIIKTTKMFNFLPLTSSSVTAGSSFLSLIIAAIISSKTVNILLILYVSFQDCIFSIFSWTSCISFEYLIKAIV